MTNVLQIIIYVMYYFALQMSLSIFTVIVLPLFQIEINDMHFPCIPSFVRGKVFLWLTWNRINII